MGTFIELYAPEVALLLDKGCNTVSDIRAKIRQLRAEAKVDYDNSDTHADREESWKRFEKYEDLARLSPRRIAAILDSMFTPVETTG